MMGRNEIYKIDFVLVAAVILVVFLGILTIYSAGFDPIDKVNNGLYKKQLVWFIAGFIFMIIATFINYKFLGDYSLYVYGFFLFLLIVTAIFGTPIRNTRAWLNFGIFSIQPSEFMKLGLVVILSKYLEMRERDIRNLRELVIPALLTLVPVLIILMQPDFGTAAVFIPILFTMLFVGGADVTH
ncbi:MAG TPA: FtsW/RodA/SpoVE family cell cycle protein, partial [Spirochaetota bacterium]|nr:FtsW/RodA/SpoVE family cell cycle protein [Spirochaetota bacterium]